MEIIRTENLSFRYSVKSEKVLSDINLNINEGEFVIISGPSGSGKSTLMRLMKKELSPYGHTEGKIFFRSQPLDELSDYDSALKTGFVMQNPHMQPVTDTVWHELAFGPENLGFDNMKIKKTVAETAAYFGLTPYYHSKVSELSGGQKQLMNLAAVMALKPSLLLLDEPTSQLDPVTAENFINIVRKLNRELGITVIMTEHHTDRIFDIADRLVILDRGKIFYNGAPCDVSEIFHRDNAEKYVCALPAAVRVFYGTKGTGKCPVSPAEAGKYIKNSFENLIQNELPPDITDDKENIIELKDVWFRYSRNSSDIIRGLDMRVRKSEMFCVLGGNGSGKTTLTGILSGIHKANRGKVFIKGREQKKIRYDELSRTVAVLPQNPQLLFAKDTVYDDLCEITEDREEINSVSDLMQITHLYEMNPFDLSGGEQQRAALAKLLLRKPEILVLDEPTKGLDAYFKKTLGEILKNLCSDGVTVIMPTHDTEFAAEYADRCMMLFDGECAFAAEKYRFFADSSFYTTPSAAAVSGYYNNVLTSDEVTGVCLKNEKK